MTRFQGPVFPSFRNQRTPESRKQWISHTGRRARLRHLRKMCQPVLDSQDKLTKAACHRVVDKMERIPEHLEYNTLLFISGALRLHDDTGIPVHEAITYLLDKFDQEEADKLGKVENEPTPEPVASGSSSS